MNHLRMSDWDKSFKNSKPVKSPLSESSKNRGSTRLAFSESSNCSKIFDRIRCLVFIELFTRTYLNLFSSSCTSSFVEFTVLLECAETIKALERVVNDRRPPGADEKDLNTFSQLQGKCVSDWFLWQRKALPRDTSIL